MSPADSNRLSISHSVLFFETSNSGWAPGGLKPPSFPYRTSNSMCRVELRNADYEFSSFCLMSCLSHWIGNLEIPLLRHTLTVSQCLTSSEAGKFRDTAELNNLAPSQCRGSFNSLQAKATSSIQANGRARPPHLFWVFSMQTREVMG